MEDYAMLDRIARSFTTNIVQFPSRNNPSKLELVELSMPMIRPRDLREIPALIPLEEKLIALHSDGYQFSGIIDSTLWWTLSGEVWQEHLSRHLRIPVVDWSNASPRNNYLIGFDILFELKQIAFLEKMLRKHCRAFQGKLFYAILVDASAEKPHWLSRSSMSVFQCSRYDWDELSKMFIPKLELVQNLRLF